MILCSGDIKGQDPDCAECDGTGVDFAETNDTGTILHPCPYCRKKDVGAAQVEFLSDKAIEDNK